MLLGETEESHEKSLSHDTLPYWPLDCSAVTALLWLLCDWETNTENTEELGTWECAESQHA